MEKIQPRGEEKTCACCGAPVTTELCPYCGKPTGLNTATAVMDYPEVECKEAHLDFWTTAFPLIFAVSFGIFGFGFPFIFSSMGDGDKFAAIICLPFAAISIGAWFILFRSLFMYFSVLAFGKEIEGTVYGYMDDTVAYNDMPGQVCKILVDTRNGKRFIMYQLKSTKRPYRVNTKIDLKVYKDRFMILNKHKYDIWEG